MLGAGALSMHVTWRWRPVLLGWPTLIVVWAYTIWFFSTFFTLASEPVERQGPSNVDERWLRLLLPAMYVPTVVIFSYINWLGWKFFRHN